MTGQVRIYDGSAIIFRANTQLPGSNKLVGLGGAGTEFERDKVWQDGLNFQKLNTYNAGLNLEYDFGPVTAYSITSYWNGNFRSRGDIDGGFGAVFLPGVRAGPHPVPGAEPGQCPEPRPVHAGNPHRVEQQRRARLSVRRLLFRRKARHFELRVRRPDRRNAVGDRDPASGQRSLWHLRLGQLCVRQWLQAAGRRALQP